MAVEPNDDPPFSAPDDVVGWNGLTLTPAQEDHLRALHLERHPDLEATPPEGNTP